MNKMTIIGICILAMLSDRCNKDLIEQMQCEVIHQTEKKSR